MIAGQSSGRVASEGPSTLTTVQKEALLTFLGISTDLHSLAPTLRNTYLKYKTLINASKTMQGLRTSQEWADHLDEHGVERWIPVFVDLVNVFIAKSQFYSSWKGLFSRAQNYAQMKAWLDESSDAESDSEVWAESKDPDHYTIADLAEWLKRKDAAKGKRSAGASSGGGKKSGVKQEKRKKERKASSEESEESSGGKKLKLKSKVKAKSKKNSSE